MKESKRTALSIVTQYYFTFIEAHENIELFLKTSLEFPQIIVGLDVGGDPTKGDIKSLLSLIKAKKQTRDFKVTIHCGEEPNSSEIKDIINFKPDRIGHGINVSPSDAKDIPWEVCLTSNIKTGGFQSYEDHVLKSLYENNIPFSICTDDSGFFDTILSTEYSHMKRSVIPQITNKDIFCIAQKSIDYIFSDDLVKNQLKQLFSDWENKNEKYF